jgi:hypothetical protein
MQGVRGSNPLSSTPGQTASPPSTARESPASGSKSAAISSERPIQRPARRCRRPASPASSPGGPGPTRAAAGGPVREGRSITDRRADLIFIRVLPLGLFPQDRACNLRERPTAGDRWRPLRTARLRWRVDQRWTRPAGQRPSRLGSGEPVTCPPKFPGDVSTTTDGVLAGRARSGRWSSSRLSWPTIPRIGHASLWRQLHEAIE